MNREQMEKLLDLIDAKIAEARAELSSEYEKLERDGKIAVLYSPCYGAGWSTWNTESEYRGILFDREIVELVLAGNLDAAISLAEKKYPGVYTSGGGDLTVEWVPKGEPFIVEEYDGAENVTIISPDFGTVA